MQVACRSLAGEYLLLSPQRPLTLVVQPERVGEAKENCTPVSPSGIHWITLFGTYFVRLRRHAHQSHYLPGLLQAFRIVRIVVFNKIVYQRTRRMYVTTSKSCAKSAHSCG